MKILVGSLNRVKINSIRESIKHTPYFENENIIVEGIDVPSDISHMPTTLAEVMQGAKNRAHNIKKTGKQAQYFIGIEGGTTIIEGKAYLFGATHILHTSGEEHVGLTNFMEVPEFFRKGIYELGKELGPLQDEASNTTDTGKKTGSYGIWSDNLITRQSAFEQSFFCAIAPFFNSFYKK